MVTGQVGHVIPSTANVTDLGAAQSGEERANRTVAIAPCSSFIEVLSRAKRLVEEVCEVWKSECYGGQQRDYGKDEFLGAACTRCGTGTIYVAILRSPKDAGTRQQ